MPETTQDELHSSETSAPEAPGAAEDALVEESLVEEVSIDGMCGVY
jgi:mycofactocin precursor